MPDLDSFRHVLNAARRAVRDLRWRFQQWRLRGQDILSQRDQFGIDRAMLSSDLAADYLFCIPLTALFWNRVLNAAVTVAAVGGEKAWQEDSLARLVVDTLDRWDLSVDVRYIPKIDGMSSGNISQAIRLWLPTQYPEEFCVLGDADLLPLQPRFFCLGRYSADYAYLWNGDAYSPAQRFPMCYVGASGNVWRRIFPAHELSDALQFLHDRYRELTPGYRSTLPADANTLGWFNDETILAELLRQWDEHHKRTVVLRSYRYCHRRRLHRSDDCFVEFDPRRANRYVDAHLPREAYRKFALFRPLFEAYVPGDLEQIQTYFREFNRILDERNVVATGETAT